jgi:uncharacterized protein (DUF302 family)
MSYYITKKVNMNFEKAESRATQLLGEQGFGILTEIDVQKTLKKKLDVDFRRYKILGACNPPFAHKALLTEDRIGVMLPCNIILQERNEGITEVSVINPMESMKAVQNKALESIAGEITLKLQKFIDKL